MVSSLLWMGQEIQQALVAGASHARVTSKMKRFAGSFNASWDILLCVYPSDAFSLARPLGIVAPPMDQWINQHVSLINAKRTGTHMLLKGGDDANSTERVRTNQRVCI
jgi:hypothetical protein